MPRVFKLYTQSTKEIDKLLKIEAVYQKMLVKDKVSLQLSVEYIFLSGFKVWENFIEKVFISQSRYNDPVSGKRTFPYLAPKTEIHALNMIQLEKQYVDWTSPDHIITRADILFRSPQVITDPIKNSLQDLRDAKKIRNYIAHGSEESKSKFVNMARSRTGRIYCTAGEFLLGCPTGLPTHYALHYLNLFKGLVKDISC